MDLDFWDYFRKKTHFIMEEIWYSNYYSQIMNVRKIILIEVLLKPWSTNIP